MRHDVKNKSRSEERPDTEYEYSTKWESEPSPQMRMIFVDHPDSRYMLEAKAWKERHGAEYNGIAAKLLGMRKDGRKHSVREARLACHVHYDHNLDSSMARLLELDFPELEGHLRMRKSKVDGLA